LTVGRLVLADITFKLGERRMIFVYLALGLAMQLLFWFIPNIIANAVAVSLLGKHIVPIYLAMMLSVMISFDVLQSLTENILIGFFIAPFFPVGLSVLTKLLPRELHVGGIGFSATVGQAGSAAFPFLTGAVASKAGVKVLQPIMVGLLAGMAILWALMPRVRRPTH
jgi:MFS family permease